MTRRGIICAGNWIVDLVHEVENWPQESDLVRINAQTMGIGGGAANVVSCLSRFNVDIPLWPFGAVGSDDYARFIRDTCADLGLPITLLKTIPDVASAHTHVMSVRGQTRTFFYHGGANDLLTVEDFDAVLMQESPARIFYLGYLILLEQLDRLQPDGMTGAAKVLKRACDSGMTTCVDLVSIEHEQFAESVGAALPYIHYLILNETEAARATDLSWPTTEDIDTDERLLTMAQHLIKGGVREAVVLHCADKSLWFNRSGEALWSFATTIPAEEIASTLGAGDAFCAGVLYALHERWEPFEALELAHITAESSLKGLTATESVPDLSDLVNKIEGKSLPQHKKPDSQGRSNA